MNKKHIFVAVVLTVLAVLVILKSAPAPVSTATPQPTYDAYTAPTPQPTATPTNTPTLTTFPIARNPVLNGVLCRSLAVDCLQSRNGGGIHFYDSVNKNTFSVNPATGNVVASGNVNANSLTLATPLAAGQYVAPTAVSTATPQPTYAYTAPTPQPTATPAIGYKVYRAVLTQSGTNAPVATVLENTLGGTVVWSYAGIGDYRATLASAFPAGKVWSFPSGYAYTLYSSDPTHAISRFSNDAMQLSVLPQTDDSITNLPIEILVYP